MRASVAWAILGVLVGGLACRSQVTPVARLEVSPDSLELAHPQTATLHLVWRPLAPLPGLTDHPVVFVHLLDQPGSVLRTFDHPFPEPWRPGETVSYEIRLYQSALAPPLPPGSYQLSVGLYDPGGRRWPLAVEGEEVDRQEYSVATVEVPAVSPTGLRFSFSPAWLSPEPAGDRQVLARRWLVGEGTIRLAEIREPGRIWTVVHLPDADRPDTRLVLEGAGNAVSVLVTSNCSDVEIHVSGPGRHDIDLPVAPPEEMADCLVKMQPNFYLLSAETLERRSIALENLTWIPGAGS